MATAQHINPCPGGHEIYNFGKHSLGIITLYVILYSLSHLCLNVEKTILKDTMHFHYVN